MEELYHFYAVIIGTEILNGRRRDRHFDFIRHSLQSRGWKLHACFVLNDDPALIRTIFEQVRRDPKSVMFSFGGIGSTPDDLTRALASEVFTGKSPVRHKGFETDILARFGDEAFPDRIFMADIPEGSTLLKNPVNNMSGFGLDSRFFFVPGFPEMAHPMVESALEQFYPRCPNERHRLTLLADTSENTLIAIMKKLPETVEFSSLPMFVDGRPKVEISVSSADEALSRECFERFTAALEAAAIGYEML